MSHHSFIRSLPGRTARPTLSGARRRPIETRKLAIEALEARQLLTVTANPDIYVALQATPLDVASPGVLGNDRTTTGTALTVTNFTQPAKGTLTLNPNGSFRYVPTTGATGADQFTYTVADAKGGTATSTVQFAINATTDEASVFAGTRLASVSSTQSALLTAVLGGLVGTNLNLTTADYNGLAGASINGGKLANALGAELGVTPGQALTTNATLGQIFTAAAAVAQADGNTAEVTAFQDLAAAVGGVTAPVQLGNLIQASPTDGSLANANLNALDLATGSIQLFNADNVVTAPTPINVSAASLGLPGIVGSVAISPQVVEAPIVTTGPAGTQFHTAAIRLRIDLNLVNDNLNTTALNAVLAPLGFAATGSLGQLSVYTEVAEGQGTIAAVNAIAGAVTLQATPGLTNVYLGNIANNLFFDRTHVINPTADVTYGTVGTLNLTSALTPAANTSTGIQLRDVATGTAPTASTEVFNAPFPQSTTVSTSTTFVTNLANTLAANLQVKLAGSLGSVLDPVFNGTAAPLLTTAVTNGVSPALAPVLSNVADPTLQLLGTRIGQLDLTVNAVSQVVAPAANPDFATTQINQAVVVSVLTNDATLPTEPVTVTAVTQPTHGKTVINADGTVTYTPTTGYLGNDTFTYTITDPNGLASTAAVTVNVLPLPPVATADTYTGTEGTPLTVPAATGVLSNDTDPQGSPLTAVIDSSPTRGTVTLNPDGSFTYTPTAGDYGPDTFTYRATDGTVFSTPVVVTVNVAPTLPTANPDTYTATVGKTLTVPVTSGVLINDTDPNGLPLAAASVVQPAHGTLTLNADGSLSYTPTAGYIGPDSFTYRATDANGASTPATVIINVQAAGLPIANPDTYTTKVGTALTVPVATGVLANDADPNGLSLSAAVATMPTHGTLTLNADGSLSYTPTAGYIGPDSFTYRATDATGTSSPAMVSITVRANGVPVANPDTYLVSTGTTLTVPAATGVLSNDTDPNGLTLAAVVTTQPTNGTLTLNSNGSLTYTPAAGFVGTDSFTYQATDAAGQSTPTTVTLNVTPNVGGNLTNPPTVVTTYPVTGTAGVPIVGAPTVSFTDGDGTTPPGSYTATINWGDGSTPSTGTVTEDNGIYTVTGGHTYAQSGTFPVGVTITRAGSAGLAATTSAAIGAAAVAANPTTSSLAGTVYLDANRNGQDDANEFGVATVVVNLTGTTATGQAVSLSTTTDASGRYQFTGLLAGTYQIQAVRPVNAFNQGGITVGTAGGVVQGALITTISLPGSTAATNYNFGEIARPGCRLNTPAIRPLLVAGPVAPLPSTFRPIHFPVNGPVARYLPTLAARASGNLATTTTVGTQQVHAAILHGKAKSHPVKVHVTRVRPQANHKHK